MTTQQKRFKAPLERGGASGLGWTIARLPFNPSKVWKASGRLRIRGEINGFPFRSSLFTDSRGRFILVNKQMQAGAGARLGQTAEFSIEPDSAERPIVVPQELKTIFRREPAVRRFYDELNASAKRDIAAHITAIKTDAARRRWAEQLAERFLFTIEAERELPPLMRLAFAEDPRAARGWRLMTATQRRGHLLGIFGYKSPESRSKRLQKAMDEATKIAERHEG